jgi:1,4-dihydroxy-2-naphthoate octaprenyltransferase
MANIKDYVLATRPAFLLITFLGCLIGLLSAKAQITLEWPINALAIGLTLLVHAGANLLNDYYDHINGCDAINEDRVSPFTGGSRYIQNLILRPRQIFGLGLLLLMASTLLGIYLCSQSTWALAPIGILGLTIAWAYSAPPLQLMSRGAWGEIAIALAWSLVVIGFATLQTHTVDLGAIFMGVAFGLMVANILFLNQVPDIKADKLAKKFTLAVKSRSQSQWKWYLGFILVAYFTQLLGIFLILIPTTSSLSLIALPGFLICAQKLKNHHTSQESIKNLIFWNIIFVHFYAALLCIGLYLQ